MASLEGTKTHENLKEAFAGESQANRRYLWFAQKADVEGYPDAERPVPLASPRVRPATRTVTSSSSPRSAIRPPASRSVRRRTTSSPSIAGETYEYTQMYPGFSKTARDEGFDRDRRVVRDPRPRREEPRRPLRPGVGEPSESLDSRALKLRSSDIDERVPSALWLHTDILLAPQGDCR